MPFQFGQGGSSSDSGNSGGGAQQGFQFAQGAGQKQKPQEQTPSVPATPSLPFLAEALDAHGAAYYGPGFQGWARKTFAKIFDPSKFVAKPTEEQAQLLEKAQTVGGDMLNERYNWDKWIGKWTGIQASDVAQSAVAANLATKGTETNPLTGEQTVSKDKQLGDTVKTVTGTLYRGSGQVISTGLEVLSVFDKGTRKVQTFNIALDEVGDTSQVLPDLSRSGDVLAKWTNNAPWASRIGNLLDAFNDLNPLQMMYNMARAATAGGTMQDKFKTVRNVNRASNMIYSLYWDEAKKGEYIRRVQAGENPDLIVSELENPWVELAGSILGDPSTYMGMGIIGKFGKASTPVRFMGKTLFHVPWETVARVPGFTEILGIKTFGKGKLLSAGDEFTKIADPALENAFKALENTADDLDALKKIQGAVSAARQSAIQFGKEYGFFARESSAKADVMKKTVGTVFQVIAGRMRNTDDMMETFKAFRNLSSTDEKLAFEAVSTLKELYGTVPFSRAGMQSMEFFNRLVDGVDIPAIATKYGDDIPGFVADVTGKLDNVIADMYPSVNDMAKAAEEVKSLGLAASERQKFLAKSYDDLVKTRPTVIWANNVNNAVGGNKMYRGLQSFFANTLMGMRPAYAMRNLQSNTFHIWHDLGSGAGAEALTSGLGAMVESTAGKLAKKDWVGAVVERNIERIKAIVGAVPTETVKGVGSAGQSGALFLGVGQDIEKVHSALIVRHVVETEMEKALRYGGIPSVSAMEKLGLPPEMSERLYQLALENWGDAPKTLKAFRQEMATGFAETWRHLELDPTFKDVLRKSNLLDELEQIRKTAPDATTFAEQMDAFINKIDDLAKRTANEPALVSADNPIGDVVVTVEKAFDEGGRKIMSEEELNQFRALNELRYQLQTSFRDVAQSLRGQITGMLPIEQAKAFDQEFANAYKVLDDGATHWRRYADEIYNGVYAQAKKGTPPSELWAKVRTVMIDTAQDGKPVLKKISLAEAYPSVDPSTLTKSQFESYLWKWFKEQQGQFWSRYTQDTLVKQTDILERMAGMAGTTLDDVKMKYFMSLDNPQLTKIDDLLKQVQEWESHIDYKSFSKLDMKGKTLAEMDKASILDEFPNWKGGKSHLFNAVNADRAKRGLEPYATIDQVPFEEAVQTLRSRGGKVTGPVKAVPKINMTEAVKAPRSELPPEVSDRIEREARRLSSELYSGQAGKRTGGTNSLSGVTWASYGTTNVSWYRELYQKGMRKPQIDKALDKIIMDQGADTGATVEKVKDMIMDTFRYGDKTNGIPPDLEVLQAMGADEKTLLAAVDDWNEITHQNKTLEELLGNTGVERAVDTSMPYYDDAGNLITPEKPIPPYVEGTMPTVTRQLYENMKGGFKDALESFKNGTLAKWGEKTPIESKLTDEMEGTLSKWAGELERRTVSNRAAAIAIANETRNFILHDYNKTYGDKFASYFLMYHYWPSRTYLKWAERIADTPGTAAAYAKWRSTMEKVHSDQPEFYRYNIPISKLPGLGDGPFFFNLESTLNPLYSLTGVDFNDPAKRVDWMSSAVDDMGKMGFNVSVPLQWAMAFRLYRKGEDEAGRRWLGRAIPATQDVKAMLNLIYSKSGGKVDLMPNISALPGAKYGELDPFVNITSGGTGIDPYEEKRVGRALAAMIQEGVKPEAAYDALMQQSGALYDEAVLRAINERAPGQVASFFFGTGYKTRTEGDMMVDEFYSKYSQILSMRENISPEDYRQKLNALKDEYPFFDTVLLAKRGGDDRDAAYAYNVIGRLPPGDSYKVLAEVGISGDMVNKFYNDKGDFSTWTEQDKNRFMGAMLDLGATYKLPDGATREEWDAAKTGYQQIREAISTTYGEDVWNTLSTYYDLQDTNADKAADFKADHPEINGALQLKREMILQNPTVYRYYGSFDTVESYFDGKVRSMLAEKFGADITDKQTMYYNLKVESASKARTFLNEHPELKAYWSEKKKLEANQNQAMVDFAKDLPSLADGPQIREDFAPANATQEQLANYTQQTNIPDWNEIGGMMSPGLQDQVVNYWQTGGQQKLSKAAQSELEYVAKKGKYYDADALLRDAGLALYYASGGQAVTNSQPGFQFAGQ